MLHTARQRSSLLIFLAALFIGGCSLFELSTTEQILKSAHPIKQKVFYATYDTVWAVAHLVLKYPFSIDNQETGTLETEYVKANEGWLAPGQKLNVSSGIRYRISMNLVKGKIDGRESTRVTIIKQPEILRDFFSPPEKIESDGLEEKVLFYRMERELAIREALKKQGL